MADGSATIESTSKYTFPTFLIMWKNYDWSSVTATDCWKFLDDYNAVGKHIQNDLENCSITMGEALAMTQQMKVIDAQILLLNSYI